MKSQKSDDELLMDSLEKYNVPYPSEDEINSTINELIQYVPKRKSPFKAFLNSLKPLVNGSLFNIKFMDKSFWIYSLVLFILGILVVNNLETNPYVVLITLSPTPFVIGLVEIFRGREEGALEIEMTCKISPQQMVLSKFITIILYNILLNSFLSHFILWKYPNLLLWKVILMWLTPLFLVGSISFLVAANIRGNFAISIVFSVWIIFSFTILTNEKILNYIMNLNIFFYIGAIILGFFIISRQIYKFTNDYISERSEYFGTNY